MEALREAGYTARVSDVICACVPDQPGGLSRVLGLLDQGGISIEYIYSFVRNTGLWTRSDFQMDDRRRAAMLFAENGIRMLSQEQVDSL